MSYQYTEEDTETWILLFLYKSPPKTIEDIVENGCHKMILKVPFDNLIKILDKMTESDLIGKSGVPIHYALKARGMHKLKNLIFTPLLDLTSDQAQRIIRQIRSSCDTKLLEDLHGNLDLQFQITPKKIKNMTASEKIQIIKRHGLQKLDIILNIVGIINKTFGVL